VKPQLNYVPSPEALKSQQENLRSVALQRAYLLKHPLTSKQLSDQVKSLRAGSQRKPAK
jgi:hypothetical protein